MRDEDDAIGELFRLADMPEISLERTARHRALARAHWQRRIRARTRRLRLTYGLAAAAALVLALGLSVVTRRQGSVSPGPVAHGPAAHGPATHGPAAHGPAAHGPAAGRPVARLATIVGPVHSPAALGVGAEIDAGAMLETGTDSRAAFRLAGGHELRLDFDTRLLLISERVLGLERGAVYVDSRGSPGSLEIRTALGTARDVGTRFEVRLDDGSLRVRVRDGVVEVDRAGETHEARTGAELTLDAAGTLARRTIAVYGPQWLWSLEVAPAFDTEGRSLKEFLDWVTRETGWRLRLNPAVARGAAAVTVSGSIVGLAPDQALGVVLPITGLRHRVADGELIVEPMTP